jgi:hypothetical protein
VKTEPGTAWWSFPLEFYGFCLSWRNPVAYIYVYIYMHIICMYKYIYIFRYTCIFHLNLLWSSLERRQDMIWLWGSWQVISAWKKKTRQTWSRNWFRRNSGICFKVAAGIRFEELEGLCSNDAESDTVSLCHGHQHVDGVSPIFLTYLIPWIANGLIDVSFFP